MISLISSFYPQRFLSIDQYTRFPEVSQFVFVKKLRITLLNSVAIDCWQVGVQEETDPRISPVAFLYSAHLGGANKLSHNMCTRCAGFIFDEITSQSSFLTTQREAVPFQNGRWAVYDKTWSLTFLPKIINFSRGQLPIALQFKYRSNVLDLIIKWNSTAARWDNFPDCGYQLHACCSCNGACELKLAVY